MWKTARILHVITPSRMAGAETFLARLLRRSAVSEGHCISSPSPANAEMRAAGMDFDTLPIGGKANLLAVPRLARAARRLEANLLHSHLSTASWWCGWLETLGGPPSIGHVHGFTSALWHRRQTHLIACSAAVKQDLIDKRISADRITVMHYPVDPDDMQPRHSPAAVRAKFGADAETPIVGSRTSPRKKATASWCKRRGSYSHVCRGRSSGVLAKARYGRSWNKRPGNWASPTASTCSVFAATWPT
jgi:glycosyltransferase involved in cell wall biosynthesis